jgi:hypothetical protein
MSELSTTSTGKSAAYPKYFAHIVALASLGFLSGLATLASFQYGRDFKETSLKGGLFGAVIALYLWAFRRVRSPWKATLIIATSVVAYNLSISLWPFSREFFAGAVGGCLVFAAVLSLAAPELAGLQRFGLIILLSIGAGFLGWFGWSLGPSLGTRVSNWMDQLGASGPGFDMLSGIHDSVYAVHPVWQSGVGALIGVLLWTLDRKTSSSETTAKKRELSVPARIFFACVLLAASMIVFNVLKTVPAYWQAHRR